MNRKANTTKKLYRDNSGVILFNQQGLVLVGERVAFPKNYQFPQGGIQSGETPLIAAIREFHEETNILLGKKNLIHELPFWLYYDFPPHLIPKDLKKYHGQKQKWFAFYKQDLLNITIVENEEFFRLQWMDFQQVCEQIVFFKKSVYQQLFVHFQPIIHSFLKP